MPRTMTEEERQKIYNLGRPSISCTYGWRPIETAPQEEWILVYVNNLCQVASYEMTDWDGFYDEPVRAWQTYEGFLDHDADFDPTHWQPLPKPPSEAA